MLLYYGEELETSGEENEIGPSLHRHPLNSTPLGPSQEGVAGRSLPLSRIRNSCFTVKIDVAMGRCRLEPAITDSESRVLTITP